MSAAYKARPHEEADAARLRNAALDRYAELRERVATVAKQVTALRETPADIVLMLAAVNHVSLAAEALAGTAKAMAENADAALLEAMKSSGCVGFASGHGTVSLRTNPQTVDLLGPVPDEFMVPRDPAPDRTALRKYLAAHSANWGRLLPGTVSLVRRASS